MKSEYQIGGALHTYAYFRECRSILFSCFEEDFLPGELAVACSSGLAWDYLLEARLRSGGARTTPFAGGGRMANRRKSSVWRAGVKGAESWTFSII